MQPPENPAAPHCWDRRSVAARFRSFAYFVQTKRCWRVVAAVTGSGGTFTAALHHVVDLLALLNCFLSVPGRQLGRRVASRLWTGRSAKTTFETAADLQPVSTESPEQSGLVDACCRSGIGWENSNAQTTDAVANALRPSAARGGGFLPPPPTVPVFWEYCRY